MHKLNITIIGGGAMGSALVAGMLNKQFVDPANITVCDPNDDQLKKFAKFKHLKTSSNNAESVSHANWIILAVKPQHMMSVLTEMKAHLNPEQLIISIAAGIKITTIVKTLKHDKVIRVMPNTPAQVGSGMSAWIATEGVDAGEKKLVIDFLNTLGSSIELGDDDEIDKATAIHASGPGYFFYVIEALMHAGIELGFSEEVAKELAVQTAYGSGVLAHESTVDPTTLKNQVTSKGGGTEAALKKFEEEKVAERFIEGVKAAYARYQELSKQ